jgi:hypothetical protein
MEVTGISFVGYGQPTEVTRRSTNGSYYPVTSVGYGPADESYLFLFYFKKEIPTASGANSHNKH